MHSVGGNDEKVEAWGEKGSLPCTDEFCCLPSCQVPSPKRKGAPDQV